MPLSESPPSSGFPNIADSPSLAAVKLAIVSTPSGGVTGLGQTDGTKHQRFTVASVPASTSVVQIYTWATAFPDANYTAVAIMFETTTVLGLMATKITAQTAASISVLITNNDAGAAHTGSLRAIAFHD